MKLHILATALVLSGCASQATLQWRDALAANCKAGSTEACQQLPEIQAVVDREANENGKQVLGGIILGLAAGAAAYNDSRPSYVIVRRCRWC